MKKFIIGLSVLLLIAAGCSKQPESEKASHFITQAGCEKASNYVCFESPCDTKENYCSDLGGQWKASTLSMKVLNNELDRMFSNNSNIAAGVPGDWQTYTNKKLNFSIKYPPGGRVEEYADGTILLRPAAGLPFVSILTTLTADPVFEPEDNIANQKTCEVSDITFSGLKAKRCDSTLNSESQSRILLINLPSPAWDKHNEIEYFLPSNYTYLTIVYEKILNSFTVLNAPKNTQSTTITIPK